MRQSSADSTCSSISRKENEFLIKDHQGRVVRYPVDKRGLYIQQKLPPVDCHVFYVFDTTIECYTPCKVEGAARARKLYYDLSAENIINVKIWLRSNQAKNLPISVDDVNFAERLQGRRGDSQGKECLPTPTCSYNKQYC